MSLPIVLEQVRSRPHAPVELDQPLPLEALPTPALVLKRSALQRNIATMASFLASHGKGFRPHAKTHKCPLICREQIAAGAVGVCVAKVGEAVAQIAGGVQNVLITSPVTTVSKAQVVGELALLADDLNLVVDSELGLQTLLSVLPADARMGVLIDIDVAMGRTGTRDAETAAALIDKVEADPRLRFLGIQHYAGHLMHVPEFAKRREKSLGLWDKVAQILDFLDARGITCDVVTGAGTGTYNIDVAVTALTDLQVGSYIFMDEEYRRVASEHSGRFDDFEVSLTVACTTISQPRQGTMTVDGGYKAFASDTVAPVSDDLAGVDFHFAGDEHGVLVWPEGEQALRLGQVVQFVTPHCDPTVNLHDYYWVQEDDELIHSCWPITARGCAW
jgi:D-serine deaminase-like pyridoxal phosphate-dependent protein